MFQQVGGKQTRRERGQGLSQLERQQAQIVAVAAIVATMPGLLKHM